MGDSYVTLLASGLYTLSSTQLSNGRARNPKVWCCFCLQPSPVSTKEELKSELGGSRLVIHKPSRLHPWKDFKVKAHLSPEQKRQVLWQEAHNDLGEQFPLVSAVGEPSTYFPRTSW